MTKQSRGARIALVLSGGIGLGVYQAGVYAALHAREALWPDWIAGSSVGAVNAAVIAGSAAEHRLANLREIWLGADGTIPPAASAVHGPWRHVQNWASVMQARVAGVSGHFRPRYMSLPFERFSSLYDLSPLRARIETLVDFGRLNSGEIRVCVAMTDIRTGELVLVDTARGERITVDHLMASCGYLPEFAPLDMGGRLLGDGGLSANAPLEAIFLGEDRHAEERVCFVVDLFPRDGGTPAGLESALARKNDLLFANQTFMRLRGFQRESVLRDELAAVSGAQPGTVKAVLYLSYGAPSDEAGPERTFDLSRATANDRWQAGALDMEHALARFSALEPAQRGWSLTVVRR